MLNRLFEKGSLIQASCRIQSAKYDEYEVFDEAEAKDELQSFNPSAAKVGKTYISKKGSNVTFVLDKIDKTGKEYHFSVVQSSKNIPKVLRENKKLK